MPAFVSPALVIDGDLSSSGEIYVDGRINGDVTCAHLIVGSGGRIDGNIAATFVEVRGYVRGDIRAQNVLLATNGRAEGNIRYHALKVETGAVFNGHCRYSDTPRGEDVSRKDAEPPRAALQAG